MRTSHTFSKRLLQVTAAFMVGALLNVLAVKNFHQHSSESSHTASACDSNTHDSGSHDDGDCLICNFYLDPATETATSSLNAVVQIISTVVHKVILGTVHTISSTPFLRAPPFVLPLI